MKLGEAGNWSRWLLCGLIVELNLDIGVGWFDSCCIYLGIWGLGKHRMRVTWDLELGFVRCLF